jgi:hypothetical protein
MAPLALQYGESDDFTTTRVQFSHDGELLATGDKGGRVVIFQRDQTVRSSLSLGMADGRGGG